MARGGYRPGAGRPSTKAQKPAPLEQQLAIMERARAGGASLADAFDALNEMRNMAKIFLSQAAEEWNKRSEKKPYDQAHMNECALSAASILKEVVKYERPQFRAIMVAPPPPPKTQDDQPRRFTLQVFEGGKRVVG